MALGCRFSPSLTAVFFGAKLTITQMLRPTATSVRFYFLSKQGELRKNQIKSNQDELLTILNSEYKK